MEEKVKNDILFVLKQSIRAIKSDNPLKLKELSNQTIHNSSINQDVYSISTAVVIYALSKIFERERYREYSTWGFFFKSIIDNLELAVSSLENDNLEKYDFAVHSLVQSINKLEPKFRRYVKDILEDARISKASRLYEHGISAARTAQLLGITEWELMAYAGKTGIPDVPFAQTKRIKDRIKFTRRLFA